jgi:uncharacterized membrane protein YsdA (DUF1294 family)/cold shock CspA family protein
MTLHHGVVVQFDTEAGYGFIRSSPLGEDVFVHISVVLNERPLRPGQHVLFTAEPSDRGLRASHVNPGRTGLTPAMLGGLVTFTTLVVITTTLKLVGAPTFWAWFGTVNLVALSFYAFDKYRATQGGRRIPEAVLLGLALLGGSPAAALGMAVLRHKTRKVSFLLTSAAIVIAQVIIGAYWFIRR